jgi:predicted DNA binding CopG/RHH family protein
MKEKALQLPPDHGQRKRLSTEQTILFVEGFRQLMTETHNGKSKLISIKIPEGLLNTFKIKAAQEGVPYQTQIKKLMMAWLKQS